MAIRDELIQRTLQQIAQLLARLITSRAGHEITADEFSEAEQELESLYLANLGTSRTLIHRFGTEDLLDVLRTAGGVHAERAYVLGALLSTEAAIQAAYQGEESPEVGRLRGVALDVLLEAGAARLGEPDLDERIQELTRSVGPERWPAERFERLLRYRTENGAYSEAENALFSWLERAGTAEGRLQVAAAADDFYSLLDGLKDPDLEKGGFSRVEIGEGRADFAERFAQLFAGADGE